MKKLILLSVLMLAPVAIKSEPTISVIAESNVDLKVQGGYGFALIRAQANFVDQTDTHLIQWHFQIYEDDRLVWETLYNKRAAIVPRGKRVTPILMDKIRLPKGNFLVQAKLVNHQGEMLALTSAPIEVK